jgi:hypothetical protein
MRECSSARKAAQFGGGSRSAEALVKGRALMPQLSPEGRRAVEDVARRMEFSADAVTSMLFSIIAGRGGMAQFNHPEFGGSGQWMSGGAIMVSDMFNNVLKARVDALCNELSALVRHERGIAATDSFQSQSQGKPTELNADCQTSWRLRRPSG